MTINKLPSTTAAAYIRVSTGKQEELSPDSQKRLILEYANKHHLAIPDEYIFFENGVSGRSAMKRPQFQTMIALAKSGAFQTILLWKFSRFARNQEESIVYKSMLKKHGVEVISISEPLVDGPFGSLIERIIEWMDEFYSIRLSGDVTRGMTEKALQGGYQCSPPFGYHIPHKKAVPELVEQEVPIIQMIFHNYVTHHISIREIAQQLNEDGYTTRRKNPFETRTIRYILSNPFYAGYICWNRSSHNKKNEKDQWIIRPGTHTPLVSDEVFNKAQELLKKSSSSTSSHTNITHWMSGLLICSCCQRTLTLSNHQGKNGRTYSSFQCWGYKKGLCDKSHCISLEKVIHSLFESLKSLDSNRKHLPYYHMAPDQKKDQIKQLQKKQKQLTQKQERLLHAYTAGLESLEEYKTQKEKLLKECTLLDEELQRCTKISTLQENKIQTICEYLLQETVPMKKKQAAVSQIIDSIVFHKDDHTISIVYSLPTLH